jgi:DEAD/DEAH box helicase domain-containing protein
LLLSVTLRYWWPSELANAEATIPPSPGFVIFNEAHAKDEPERHLMWRRWLWLFNILQTLPGVLLATQNGLDAGDHSGLTISSGTRPGAGAPGAANTAAWEKVIGQAMDVLGEGLHALMDAGLPPPDEVGYELEQMDGVAAEAELAWLQRKLVLLMPVHAEGTAVWRANGWKTVVAENDWPQRLSDELVNRAAQEDIQQEVRK